MFAIPHIDSDPKSIITEEYPLGVGASSVTDDFDEKNSSEHCIRTSKKKHNHDPSEEEQDNLFREEHNLELTCGTPLLDDILRHTDDSGSPGNRDREGTRRWAFELLRTCGITPS
jgi:hypothetical protein